MASSNIKLFDENKGNMLSDSEFSISNQRMNGLQTGVASSQLQNKAMYQASLVAYAIAQIMMQNGKNANDTDAVSAFVANLSSTILQKVYDAATIEEAKAGAATGKWMSPALVKAAIDTLAAKAQNILSDETKALYGLGSNAVPDDVLKAIGGLPIPVSSGGTGATSLSAFAEVLAPVLGVGKNRFTTLKTYNAPNTAYYEATVSLSDINWASWDMVHIDLYSTNGQQGNMKIVGTNGEELNALAYTSGYQRRVTLFPGYNASRYICAFNGANGVSTRNRTTYSQLSSLVFTNAERAKITIIGEP